MSRARIAIAFLALAVAVPFAPVSVVEFSRSDGSIVRSTPLSLGSPIFTSYIHSVEQTAVIDEYRTVNGELWGWEETIRSHNAGLPTGAPLHGSFVVSGDKMIVRGGRTASRAIVSRVGTPTLGANRWRLPPFSETDASREFAGERIVISCTIRPLICAQVIGWN